MAMIMKSKFLGVVKTLVPICAFLSTASATTSDIVNVHVTTFNVAGAFPRNVTLWLDAKNQPNLVVIGLQEMVELTTIAISRVKEQKWLKALKNALPKNYEQVQYARLVGILLVVYQKTDPSFMLSNLQKAKIPTGILDVFGNKGGVGISMTLNNFKICFINSHLSAGQTREEKRIKDVQIIQEKMLFWGRDIYDHHLVVWMGDMNSRLNVGMPREEVIEKIEKDDYLSLLQYDQLKNQQQKEITFVGYHEPQINFKPTYKFDIGTSTYDTSPKRRLPAWCDRILHWKARNVGVEQSNYLSRHDIILSDHKPVQSMFRFNITV